MEYFIGILIYFVIGLCFTPFFTRYNFYDEVDKDRYTGNEAWAKRQAKKAAEKAYFQSLAWPVFLFVLFNSNGVLRNLDNYHENKEKVKKAEQIVAQYQYENSWETKFRKLEAETKKSLKTPGSLHTDESYEAEQKLLSKVTR